MPSIKKVHTNTSNLIKIFAFKLLEFGPLPKHNFRSVIAFT